MKIPTIKIKDGSNGFIRINKSDFDKEKHELFEEIEGDEENGEVLITLSKAQEINRDELRVYAKQFGITGTSKEGILGGLIEAGKLLEEKTD